MKQYFSFSKLVLVILLATSVIGFSAFRQKQKGKLYSFRQETFSKDNDTSSRKRVGNGADRKLDKLNDEMKQLDIEMKNLEKEFKNEHLESLNEQLEKVDMKQIQKEIEESLQNISSQKIDIELSDVANLTCQLQMAKAEKALKKVESNLRLQAENIHINTEEIRANVEIAVNNAKKSIENTRKEIQNLQEFTTVLEKDGLIKSAEGYKVEVKNNELFINGKKQTKEISDRYRKYYLKSNFVIDMNDNDAFHI